ncbi:Gfo/Idh/MocA family protein [Paenibacillus cymbidii]|uniref:Gfo/Idh/MocA family protein n=1 Tax=Paenibacillus cymbidii TaxID=1639034 RepID=UPI001081E165|nr:Gfo/Idh/MocA family oxidoreductase [Paenibacillus cymbidii]
MTTATLTGLLIGAGHFAHIQMEAWQAVRGGAIGGILSRTKEEAALLADRYGIPAFGDWDDAVRTLRPDFLDICTPPDSHLSYAKRGADRGLPVLCQKPVAPTLAESQALVAYCAAKGVPLMINENWRWQGWYREIRRMIDLGMLGIVYHVYFAMRPGDGWGEEPYPVQPYFKTMPRFLMFETGVHWLDTFRFLFGELDSVYCQTRKINPVIAGEDLAVVHVNFASGAVGIYDANRTTYMEQVRSATYGCMTVEGTEGKLRLDENGAIFYTPRGGTEAAHEYRIPDGWKGGGATFAQQHFIDGLRDGVPFESSGEQYLQTVRAVYACYESAERQQVVRLGQTTEGKACATPQ